MGTPADHLPPVISDDAINMILQITGLPQAITITRPKVIAQYHSIYFLTLPPTEKSRGHSELVLRVSGHHIPVIKTMNEIGVMTWLSNNTTIPLPDIIAYDSSVENPIHHEYTLLSRVQGVTLSDICDTLDDGQILQLLDQLIEILCQLQDHPWEGIGGLVLEEEGQPKLGPIVDETFWQTMDVEALWPEGETVTTLNIRGPFPTYVDFVSAQIQQSVRLIQIHDNLAFMRDLIPRLEAFVAALQTRADDLNKVKLRLAHKDLHFANVMIDTSGEITGILDWEFSGVVPFTKWNPRRSFLWNGLDNTTSLDEKQRLLGLFIQRCKEKGISLLEDANYASPLQESMQKVADFLRGIVEVSPRNQRQHLVQGWRETVLENISKFGV
ncbi:hypothetical protein CDV36_010927 [Fusarium kuroshium]|uniref:Aminoglycoside phosphotransferase domain-containing protein n=3 Tax=Fusarium solani species complex TaxID=232080 RepID=A0A3M2RW07_9HYPO|nr:hypothetical protein CDV36_010927 [Fusarium kuroshium]RSL42284.1 hypothetical protein CEP51_016496 [Fusarium floridanum]